MSHHEQPRGAGYKLAWYATVAVFSLGYFGYNFRIDRADLTVPICHPDGDGRGVLSVLKGVEEHGWSGQADRLGAPETAERYDYPLPEHLHYATTWLIGRVTRNLFVTFNVWVILSYPLAALCAFGGGIISSASVELMRVHSSDFAKSPGTMARTSSLSVVAPADVSSRNPALRFFGSKPWQ